MYISNCLLNVARPHFPLSLSQCVYQLLCSLHERDSRRPFCPPRHWEMAHLSKISAPPDLFLETDGQLSVLPQIPRS